LPVPGEVPAYRLRGVVRRHGEVLANDGIDLDVGVGEVFGLLGPNGAGKTTLVRQLVGLLQPDSGSIDLFGTALGAHRGLAARTVAYLPQDESAIGDLTVRLAVETTARLRGLPKREARRQATALLDELGLGTLADRVVARMSGGQRRLAGVATALAGSRRVLVLDEPTNGLDPTARRAVWSALDRRRATDGVTVVLVTHNVLEAESVLDRVAFLDRGRVLACDTPGRLKAQVSDEVRLDLIWRSDPPVDDATVASLEPRAHQTGRRWSIRLPVDEAREALTRLTTGAAFAALDDFTLATPSLEDVYLALGGADDDGLERQ
jgi:ABC-2 type transport system ATP-binding protein